MCGPSVAGGLPSRRQVVLAGAALPLLVRLPRAVPTVALGGVAVQPRGAWGGDLKPKGPLAVEAAGDVRFLLVHHTASPNGYAEGDVPRLLRGFYDLHTTGKGWADIAYNFLVDRFGQVWEGRTGSLDGPVRGDATGGSQGFDQLACFIGDHTAEPPTGPALDAMARLLGAMATRYGIDVRPGTRATFTSRGSNLYPAGRQVTTPTIAGHRQMSKTACPGDACFPLIQSRLVPAAAVAAAGGAAVRPTQAVTPTPTPAGTAPPAEPAATPPAESTAAPGETLPVVNPGGAPRDPGRAPMSLPIPASPPAPPPTIIVREAAHQRSKAPLAVGGGVTAGVVAVGTFVAQVLRRRGTSQEAADWERARTLDEGE